ncbi:MAG: SprT family zinc-dependent metalloprotease [Bacteroidota bacterium]
MKKVFHTHLDVNGKMVPAKIYRENRYNVRASIGKKAVILRMPMAMNPIQQKNQLAWFSDWVEKQFQNHQDLHSRFFGKGYKNGDTLRVGQRTYLLQFDFSDRKTHSGKLKDGVITLHLSQQDTETHRQKSIKHLLSRLVGQDFLPQISRRVHELNNLFFHKSIKSINLKYNQTNWGSCSAKGNVNLSTRLLFAPDDVIDYVIIHELAHLIELNHSSRFWKLVSDAMPNYREKERWLKEKGQLCNF